MADYPKNSRVYVKISRYCPAGLRGKVESSQRAIIRQREIAWNKPQSYKKYIGKTKEAIVLGYDPVKDQLELSLRLVERDPWKDAESKYAVGREVEGKVVGLIEGAAFIELEQGVDAYLPTRELPISADQRVEDWLWIHDQVKALVTEIHPHQRRLRISIRALLAQRENRIRQLLWSTSHQASDTGITLAEYLPKDVRIKLLRMNLSEEGVSSDDILLVLVIEDDQTFAAGMQRLLQNNGCQVTLAEDGMKGLDCVREQDPPFDLILVDWNLPKVNGYEVIDRLRKDGCPSRVIMVLDPVQLREQPEIWEELISSDFDIYSKADGSVLKTSMITILGELRENGSQPNIRHRNQFPEKVLIHSEQFATLNQPLYLSQRYQDKLQAILQRIKQDAKATTVALLHLDPGRSSPTVDAYEGTQFPLEQSSPDLMFSPLNDIFHKNQEVYEKDVSDLSRFSRLLELMQFRGFIGVPVPFLGVARYGLLLLRRHGGFNGGQLHLARISSYLIAGILQERRLIQTLQPWQAQHLIGQLTSSILHEVNNKLISIDLLVDSLNEELSELARWPEKAEDATFLSRLERDVEKISAAQQQASGLRDWYLGLTATDDSMLVDLGVLANDMIRALGTQARQNNVILSLDIPRDLPPVRARLSQLRQIFLNVMLNAIQQMAIVNRDGRLVIQISNESNADLPLMVQFSDDGPGIHPQLWEHIFEFGFTTKRNGAGLGLTISRQAATSIGGRLRVENSHIFWGSTFLLELPYGV